MSEEFIYVPVPNRWVSAVYAKLNELSEHENGSTVPHEAGGSGGQQDGEEVALDPDLIRRMYDESDDDGGHQRLMRLLAKNPEVWYYTSDLGQALGREHGARAIAGMLGAFGRRSKHRYGGRTPWISEWDPARHEARHRMSTEVAEVIDSISS